MTKIYIFGEVLIDCFPTGEEILGGAPFNVAWHLQALGNHPVFISKIGDDVLGDRILQSMRGLGLETEAVQIDSNYPTGRVEVTLDNNEPSYTIVANSAYDFISAEQVPLPRANGILYHGTLCLRHETSRAAYRRISGNQKLKIFLDVNLRAPWWQEDEVVDFLSNAHWVKMNEDELQTLSGAKADIQSLMAEMQTAYELEQLIVTRGERGTIVRTNTGEFYSLVPERVSQLVDTVGAGDAFSAVYIHGLLAGLPVDVNLHHAQQFASQVIGLRGAITEDLSFYQDFVASLSG